MLYYNNLMYKGIQISLYLRFILINAINIYIVFLAIQLYMYELTKHINIYFTEHGYFYKHFIRLF